MGGMQGKPSTIATMLRNFKKRFSRNYGVTMTLGKLRSLCKLEDEKTGRPHSSRFESE